jgi:hypothetical protein
LCAPPPKKKKKRKGQASSGTKTQSPSKERTPQERGQKLRRKAHTGAGPSLTKALLSMRIEIGFLNAKMGGTSQGYMLAPPKKTILKITRFW